MKVVRIGKRWVGEGQPCFLAAEVGINHNGDMDLAHRSIDAAADAGADAVKFQNYHTEDFLSDRSLTYEYVSQGKTVVEPQYDMFKRCELAPAQLRELRAHCDRREVIFFSTPTSEKGIQELLELGMSLLKNGSDYLVNLPLIRAMARTGLPTVISTGMATLDDVKDGVEAFRGAGGKDLILLHCTSSYPTPPEDVHLRKIGALSTAFDCVVGLSDHTEGTVAAIGAVALGACMIEKHFTLDRNLPPQLRQQVLAALAVMIGLTANVYRPAANAAVADLVPEEERVRAFGLLYWAENLGFSAAAIAGGVIATHSFPALFLADAVTSVLFAIVIMRGLHGTRVPASAPSGSASRTDFSRSPSASVRSSKRSRSACSESGRRMPRNASSHSFFTSVSDSDMTMPPVACLALTRKSWPACAPWQGTGRAFAGTTSGRSGQPGFPPLSAVPTTAKHVGTCRHTPAAVIA